MGSPSERSHVVDNSLIESAANFIPNVDEQLKPQIGMIFGDIQHAEVFYTEYATCGGFQVRSSSTKYVKEVLVDKVFCCRKGGETKSTSKGVRRVVTNRTNCNAKIRLKLDKKEGTWILYQFDEDHNHLFTSPFRRHLLPANRNVSKNKKVLLEQFNNVNIPINKQMAYFESSSGGFDRVGFTETDVRNYKRDLREERRGHDAQMLMDYFKWKQENDPCFYYSHKIDNEGRLTHCFWVDGIGRLNAEHFGDVVAFDATHNTNQYGLIFVAFVGINHHWQSTFLGCGLLPSEEAVSFVWIFERWLEVVGHPPSGMVTDQDLGICSAIKIVFPQIRHRFCIWHILDKLPTKLQSTYTKEFACPFKDNIWNADSALEFETEWEKILKKHGLEKHSWLKEIYDIRMQWAPVYHKSHFWAGMSSSQRSEGMNAFLKMHVSQKNSLHDFVILFERVLERQRQEELKEDHRTLEKKPTMKSFLSMEKQMSKVYTLNMFYIFQEQLQLSLYYNIVSIDDGEFEAIYQVNFWGNKKDSRVLKFCKSNQMANCSCHMLEFEGIPCRHILALLKYFNHGDLPEQYILKRWRIDVKRKSGSHRDGRSVGHDGAVDVASRFSVLTCLANQIVDEGLASNEVFELACCNMHKIIEELHCLKVKDNEDAEGEDFRENRKEEQSSQISVYEPNQVRTKGRPSGKRLKPLREKLRGHGRKCHACGKKGQNHDSRNCPTKLNG